MQPIRWIQRHLPWTCLLALGFSALGLEAQTDRPPVEEDVPYSIHLKSGSFAPAPGVEPALRPALVGKTGTFLGLVQFEDVPDVSVRAQLEKAGVELLAYIPHQAWIARLPTDVDAVRGVISVRWVGRLLPEDKLDGLLFDQLLAPATAGELALTVEAAPGDLAVAAAQVRALGGRVLSRERPLSLLDVRLGAGAVRALAASDAVVWVASQPERETSNDRSRAYSRVDPLQIAPYSLNGTGVQLGIWDGGPMHLHPDFSARLTRVETTGGTVPGTEHATHVTGTMAGNGARSTVFGFPANFLRGMATNAQIVSYVFDGNPPAEHNGAINTWGIDNSQNSWGFGVSTAQGNCALFGDYPTESRSFDQIVTGLYGRRIPVVFAAGNDRDDLDCGMSAVPPFLNYGNLAPPGTAKNVISVGAMNGDNNTMTTFSSWGPTNWGMDGRLRPDLVAAGCHSAGPPAAAIASTIPTSNGYGATCGTSMAAPAVSGSIALLLQRYRTVCPASGADPLPSTIKAWLVHGALDLDDGTSFLNRGPDYATGYGRMDTQASVDLVPFYREDQVTHGQVDTFQITVTQQRDLKITLVWDDTAGAANAAIPLVNDLDLELVEPNGITIHRPWTLAPGTPAANAVRTVADRRNVVEQVLVDNVTSANAGVWTIRVRGFNVPGGATQRYSLVTQHLAAAHRSCVGAAAGDAWIMDKDVPLAPVDTGAEPNPDPGAMWISNQIWVRHAADNVMVHMNPEFGQNNFVYARVRNQGASTLQTVRAMVYFANANVGLSWPRDWTLIGESTVTNLAPGASRFINPVVWQPPGVGHYCLYVRLITHQDPITFAEGTGVQANTRNNDEIAWRNVNVVNLIRGTQGQPQEILVGNTQDAEAVLELSLQASVDAQGRSLADLATVTVLLSDELLAYAAEQGVRLEAASGMEQIDDLTFRLIAPVGVFTPLPSSGRFQAPLRLLIENYNGEGTEPLYTLDVNQNFTPKNGGVGGAGVIEVPVEPVDDPNTGGVRFEVVVPSGAGELVGFVTDSDGNGLPGVQVSIDGDAQVDTVTDDSGAFQFSGLPAGVYSLSAALSGFASETIQAFVPNGNVGTVSLVLVKE